MSEQEKTYFINSGCSAETPTFIDLENKTVSKRHVFMINDTLINEKSNNSSYHNYDYFLIIREKYHTGETFSHIIPIIKNKVNEHGEDVKAKIKAILEHDIKNKENS